MQQLLQNETILLQNLCDSYYKIQHLLQIATIQLSKNSSSPSHSKPEKISLY